MIIGRKYRAKPRNKKAREAFYTWSAAQMLTYNALVQERLYFFGFYRKFGGSLPPIDQKYSHLINSRNPEFSWLRSVPSQVFRNAAVLHKKAWSNSFAGITRRPVCKKIKNSDRSLWLTKELFNIRRVSQQWCELTIGTKRNPGGAFLFKAHREFSLPASVHIKSEGQNFFVSFSFDNGEDRYPENEQEKIVRLSMLSEEELREVTVGIDRGVKIPAQCSTGEEFDFSRTQKDRMASAERKKKHYQRMMARRTKGGKNWLKARQKARKASRYCAKVRKEFAHQTSVKLIKQEEIQVIAIENLRVKSMTGRPEPKQSESGKYLPNNATAKAGLNRSILASAWGLLGIYLKYKAERAGKLIVEVPAPYTSQTCSRCGCQDKNNRKKQALFRCTSCGFSFNADRNAAMVIMQRAINLLRSGALKPKEVRRTMRLSSKRACSDAEAGTAPSA